MNGHRVEPPIVTASHVAMSLAAHVVDSAKSGGITRRLPATGTGTTRLDFAVAISAAMTSMPVEVQLCALRSCGLQ